MVQITSLAARSRLKVRGILRTLFHTLRKFLNDDSQYTSGSVVEIKGSLQ
jgi:hypothetical protein